VDASSEVADGNWQLRVRDMFRSDVGTLESWSISL
jgi:subtilisin-like proprotein convertase family protein